MQITQHGLWQKATLRPGPLPDESKSKLLTLVNEETEEEFEELLEEAAAIAEPMAWFCVSSVESVDESAAIIGGVRVESPLVAKKLGPVRRCFPYVISCGPALEQWSLQYQGDFLTEFWADEIKKHYLTVMIREFLGWLKAEFHIEQHYAALNPGSLKDWPLSGQRELFDILGGRETVHANIGVTYTDSFLMLPSKSVSGVGFESGSFYENCQYCPLEKCPNRRAVRITE